MTTRGGGMGIMMIKFEATTLTKRGVPMAEHIGGKF
jgi:hypothetical protein